MMMDGLANLKLKDIVLIFMVFSNNWLESYYASRNRKVSFCSCLYKPSVDKTQFDVGPYSCVLLSSTDILKYGQVSGGSSLVLNCLKDTVLFKALNENTTGFVFNI
jgi:hypothetical protein